jgi:uncharacterized protein (DUF433 family)
MPQYGEANVVLDPYRGYGQPAFGTSGAKVSDALGPLRAGETFESVAEDYGVSETELRDALDAIAPDPEIVAALPHVFINRSLGAVQVPTQPRAVGPLTPATSRWSNTPRGDRGHRRVTRRGADALAGVQIAQLKIRESNMLAD